MKFLPSLKTTGRKSGRPRETPLAFFPHEGDYYVVASNCGLERHPDWSYNLLARPEAEMTHRGETLAVCARQLDDAEKHAIWPVIVGAWPVFETYAARTDGIREIRVFRLERR